MKKIILTVGFVLCVSLANAQVKDTFDSNNLGWNEIVQKDGEAIITEGVMRLEGKRAINDLWTLDGGRHMVNSYCYAPLDVRKNFSIKCTAVAKKITDKGAFGIIFDQLDEYNQSVIYITKWDNKSLLVRYYRKVNGEYVGYKANLIKIKEKKNAEFEFELKSTFDRFEFFVNGDKAIEMRNYPITYSGFGFELHGQLLIDFDNVEFVQY